MEIRHAYIQGMYGFLVSYPILSFEKKKISFHLMILFSHFLSIFPKKNFFFPCFNHQLLHALRKRIRGKVVIMRLID